MRVSTLKSSGHNQSGQWIIRCAIASLELTDSPKVFTAVLACGQRVRYESRSGFPTGKTFPCPQCTEAKRQGKLPNDKTITVARRRMAEAAAYCLQDGATPQQIRTAVEDAIRLWSAPLQRAGQERAL